ncbi:MAG: TonB-dependent receptor [Acidobacteria bacterium]|nr:TonB-dependent receptor [Acidobacteriota bacterium]
MIRFFCVAWMAWAGWATEHSGIVRCAGEPVGGAQVFATRGGQRLSAATGESGRYVFATMEPGEWDIEVRHWGFESALGRIAVAPGALPAEWRLSVAPPSASAAGEVKLPTPHRAEPGLLPPDADPADASESFLVAGSLSRGLEIEPKDDELGKLRTDWVKDVDKGPPLPGAPKPEKQLAGVQGRFEAPGEFAGFGGPASGGPATPKPKPEPKKKEGKKEPGVAVFGNRVNRRRDKLHGSAFASQRNSALDARPYAFTGQPAAKPSYAQTRTGLAVGGPLYIPKLVDSERTFVFLSYSATRSRNPYHATATLPSVAERRGDFSDSHAPEAVLVFDPSSHLPFPAQRISASRIGFAARGLAALIPLPNLAGRAQNYVIDASLPQNSDEISARVNHSVSARDHVDVSWAAQFRRGENAQLYGFRDTSDGSGLSAGASWLHSLGGMSINILRSTDSRSRNGVTPFFAFGRDVARDLGLRGPSSDPVNFGPPNLNFTNFGALADASAMLRRDRTLSVSDAFKWHREEHKVDAGIEFRRTQLNSRTDQNARGSFVFSGLATSRIDDGQPAAGTGFDFADFLLGLPQSSSIRFGSADTDFRGSVWSAFLQDDWKGHPRLSLKYGLRYEYFQPLWEKYDRIANLDIAPGFTAVAAVTPGLAGPFTGRFPRALVEPDRNNFSPRAGLAWRPFEESRLTVRLGYGVFFDGSIFQRFPAQLAAQPPFAKTAAVNTSAAHVLTLEDGFAAAPAQTISNTFAVDRNYRAGYAQTWNLSVKHDLAGHMGYEAGYLGTKGTRLNVQRMPNRSAPGSPLTAEDRRRIGNAVGFAFDSSEGNSIFHAVQLKLIRHFHRGLGAEALYTLSKSIDNVSTFGGGGVIVAQDDRNLRLERGLSGFDQRHRVGISWLWNVPAGDTATLLRADTWWSRLLGNWTAGGTLFRSSGAPLTARVLGNRSDAGGTGAVGAGRADATGEPVHGSAAFFNQSAFRVPPAGRFGNAARNTIPGRAQLAANLAVARSFRLFDDRRKLEFRAESTNFANHPAITAFGTVVNSAEYSLATGAQPMRTVVLHLRVRF